MASPRIHVTLFAGMRPAVYTTKRNRQAGGGVADLADMAENAYLHDGSVKGYANDTLETTLPFYPKTIYKLPAMECCQNVYALDKCASVTAALPDICGVWDEVLVWARESGQEHRRVNPCTNESQRLWVDAPTTAPTVVVSGPSKLEAESCGPTYEQKCGEGEDLGCNVNTAKGADEVIYLTTFVDKFGVESPPSPPSMPLIKWDDQPVTITNIGVSPPPNAVCVRIYRTSSSFNIDPKANKIGFDTTFQTVEELLLPVSSYVDNARLADIAWGTLLTTSNCPPPKCLSKVEYTETGHWVGYNGHEIHFSERNEFWNWPEKYRLSVPDKITGLVTFGDVLFIGTTGNPYRLKITSRMGKDGEFDSETTAVPFIENYPCLQCEAMCATSWGAAYVSQEGIIGLQPSGVASNMTRYRIDEEQWITYAPNRLVWFDGRLYGTRTPTNLTIVLDFPEKGEGRGIELGDFHTLNLRADQLHSGFDGKLYFTQRDELFTLGTARGRKKYRWKSRMFRMAGITRMAALQIFAEYGAPVTFRLWGDGVLLATKSIASNAPCWLPMHCRARDFQFEISGNTTVSEVHIAASMRELDSQSRAGSASAQ